MILIGIVTGSKSEDTISALLKKNKSFNENNVIFIKETNISNIKNVHFDTIIINSAFSKMDELQQILSNSKNIVINMDEHIQFDNIKLNNVNVITYGFNSKSSITISSVTEDDALICIQRNIFCNKGIIEPQEIRIENAQNYSVYDLIIELIMFFIYSNNREDANIKGK